MLTFLAIAARKKFSVDDYRDEAVGVLAKNAEGRLAITTVTLARTSRSSRPGTGSRSGSLGGAASSAR
jgi:hypothetical protein